ncbi:MAG: hypothetical protein ACYS1C_02810 [Planctomycetota bacterium]|jgi:hypothetical protein
MARARLPWRFVTAPLYVAVFGIVSLSVMAKPWPGSDYWVHLAAVRTLAAGGEMAELSQTLHVSPALAQRHQEPLHLLCAAVLRRSGLSGSDVMVLAGILNVAVFLGGMLFLCRCLSCRWTLPVSLLVVTMLLWGTGYGWSSEYALSALPRVASYPATLAWGLSFFAFGLLHAWSRRGGLHLLGAAVVLGAAVTVVHGLTALMFTLSLPVLWVWTGRVSWRRRLAVCIYPLVALGLSLLWPHHSIVEQALAVTARGVTQAGAAQKSFGFLWPERMLVALGPIPAGLLFLALVAPRWRRRLGASTVAYGLLWVGASLAGVPLGHRFVFFLAFLLHLTIALALARGLCAWELRPGAAKAALPPVALVACVMLLIPWGPLQTFRVADILRRRCDPETLAIVPSDLSLYEEACAALREDLPAGARIISDGFTARRLAACGLPVVPGGGLVREPSEFVGTDFVRAAAESARQHGATHLALEPGERDAEEQENLEALGVVMRLAPHLVLVELTVPESAVP